MGSYRRLVLNRANVLKLLLHAAFLSGLLRGHLVPLRKLPAVEIPAETFADTR
jgi:hypothetical protein